MKTFAVKVNTPGSLFSKKYVVNLENPNDQLILTTILKLKEGQTITNVIEIDVTKECVIEI